MAVRDRYDAGDRSSSRRTLYSQLLLQRDADRHLRGFLLDNARAESEEAYLELLKELGPRGPLYDG